MKGNADAVQSIKPFGEEEIWLHLFEASELDGRKRTASNPHHVIYGQSAPTPHHDTHYVDCWAE
jgi:hypothetical protein